MYGGIAETKRKEEIIEMNIKTNVKAGGLRVNHSQGGLKTKSVLKAGGMRNNHNQSK